MEKSLAEILRPTSLEDFFGQKHLVGKGRLLHTLLGQKRPFSLLLWGPPGCGKTTLARIYAAKFEADFKSFSATEGSLADFKQWLSERNKRPLFAKKPVVFIDEIHRFHKGQQDLFLPLIERGDITLIGATTENPSFAINHALLSRLRVLSLESLEDGALHSIIDRFLSWSKRPPFSGEIIKHLIDLSSGDARHLLNLLEHIHLCYPEKEISPKNLEDLSLRSLPQYDKQGDGHYNLISALHKAVRGSDPDAAVYWLCRMLIAGEDPRFLLRRMIRMAMEDIGLADPEALTYMIACSDAFERLGSPEGEIGLVMGIVYLALAPKSNACYLALNEGIELAKKTSSLPPPKHILNAPTKLMKEQNFGKGYQYDHDLEHAFSGQNYFPDALDRQTLYTPVSRGFEREMQKRIHFFLSLRSRLQTASS